MRRVGFGLLLSLSACLPSDATTTGSTSLSQQSSGAHTNLNPSWIPFPTLAYPEDRLVKQTRLWQVANDSGSYDFFRENFYADGLGQIALSLEELDLGSSGVFSLPSNLWQATYLHRQRYLVRYRDLHLGTESLVRSGYEIQSLPAPRTVSGRSGVVWKATSRFGYGKIEFVVDQLDDLLLEWSRFDSNGVLLASMTTESLDPNPDLSSVLWSEAAAPEQPYTGSADDPLLGFSPMSQAYVPAGFVEQSQRMILTEQVFGTLVPNIHLVVYFDGVRYFMVAQQSPESHVSDPQARALAVKSEFGGIRLLEGAISGAHLYVIGSLPWQELLAVYGSAG